IVGEKALLEIKTTSAWHRNEVAEDRLPDRYIIQGQHYLAVTGRQRCYYAVLVGGQRLVITHVDRADELIAQVIELERERCEHVEDGTPPPVDGPDDARELLDRLYPEADPESVAALPPDAEDLIRAYREAREAEREAAARRQEAESGLTDLLGGKAI